MRGSSTSVMSVTGRYFDHTGHCASFRCSTIRSVTGVCRNPRRSLNISITPAQEYPGAKALIPTDRDCAMDVRLWDRIFDKYVHTPMQQIAGDRLQPTHADLSGQRVLLDTTCTAIDGGLPHEPGLHMESTPSRLTSHQPGFGNDRHERQPMLNDPVIRRADRQLAEHSTRPRWPLR